MISIKNRLHQALILFTLSMFTQVLATAQQLSSPEYTDTSAANVSLSAKLDELMTAYTDAGLFNGTVLIRQDEKTLLSKGYGFSNLALGKTNNAETKYALYSITKAMTATLILQQIQAGQLKLDDKLSQFYPSFPAADSKGEK